MARNQNQTSKPDNGEGKKDVSKGGASQETKKQIFISNYKELRLIVKPSYCKEVEGRIVTYQGKSIQFHDGIFETEDQDEIKFLEGHKNFGNTFVKAYTGDARKERENKYKDLDTREKELKATIARLQDENKRLKDEKENAGKGDGDSVGDGAEDGEGGKDGESVAY